jgi:hypothetical protein
MQNPETKKGRGESAMRITLHKQVHELHESLVKEAGEYATQLPKSYFVDKIAEKMGYSTITVSRIMNQKPE